MKEGVPSTTSFLVAFARGVGVGDEALDPLARDWLPRGLGWLVDAPKQLGTASPLARALLRRLTFGMVDHIVLRTKAIDAHLSTAVAAGVEQVVILGAGLDARAWRLDDLRSCTVYEVDHPSTQGYKQERVGDSLPIARVHFVSVDFEREGFSQRLREAGHDPSRPTAWIWEGVAMYLAVQAVKDSVAEVTACSARGSSLIMSYREPGRFPFGAFGRATIPAVFQAAGEPLKASFSSREIPALLGSQWEAIWDEDPHGWHALSGSSAKPSENFIAERLVVARRREIA